MRFLLPTLLIAALLTAGCGAVSETLGDEAACPGETCSGDAQARYDAIAALDKVTAVETVARTSGLDKGSANTASVTADVADEAEARAVALDVLGELNDWPDHLPSTATATVTADPAVEVDYVERGTVDLTNPYYRPCSPSQCEDAIADLQGQMSAEIDGLEAVELDVSDGLLRVSGTTDAESYSLAASGAERLVHDAALRLADRLEVVMRATGPLVLTLRLRGDRVCVEEAGTTASCDEDNSEPFEK